MLSFGLKTLWGSYASSQIDHGCPNIAQKVLKYTKQKNRWVDAAADEGHNPSNNWDEEQLTVSSATASFGIGNWWMLTVVGNRKCLLG